MAILSKACKPDNFKLHNSLKLNFTNIWGLRSNFVDCESCFESNSPDILPLYQTNVDDSIDSGKFSMRGYLPLIQKDSSTHTYGVTVMLKKDFLLHGTWLIMGLFLLLFPLSINFFAFVQFLILFHLT